MIGRRSHMIEHDGRPRSVLQRVFLWISGTAVVALAVAIVPGALSADNLSEWNGWRGPRQGAGSFPDAVEIGREAGGVLYACRGAIKDNEHVGRIRADFEGCHIGFDGHEIEVKPYELLSVLWRPGEVRTSSALVAGSERVRGMEASFATADLYVCRASYQGAIHSGQARADENGCSFGFGGKRIVATNYEVLQASPWLTWTAATPGTFPATAILTGAEGGEPFYACRAADRNGLHPGKVKRGPLGCSIVSDGREATIDRFEVLTPRWEEGHAGSTPIGSYLAGRENAESQFLCRAQLRDTVQVGKVNETLGGCHIGMQGREVVIGDYEVLSQ